MAVAFDSYEALHSEAHCLRLPPPCPGELIAFSLEDEMVTALKPGAVISDLFEEQLREARELQDARSR